MEMMNKINAIGNVYDAQAQQNRTVLIVCQVSTLSFNKTQQSLTRCVLALLVTLKMQDLEHVLLVIQTVMFVLILQKSVLHAQMESLDI